MRRSDHRDAEVVANLGQLGIEIGEGERHMRHVGTFARERGVKKEEHLLRALRQPPHGFARIGDDAVAFSAPRMSEPSYFHRWGEKETGKQVDTSPCFPISLF